MKERTRRKEIQMNLVKYFPHRISNLMILGEELCSCSNSFVDLTKIASRVEFGITLNNMVINLSQLKKILVAFKHLETLNLDKCKLSISKLFDFSEALKTPSLRDYLLKNVG
ncbi:unnamed protein product [Moneuplotes crassus]|uniref:Uncharacterized protein n=1 Tax=Euplotes crassus TaxID=5936 RepID=A0AAD2D451_EUPCR|nr:unnamed protein product [Moneuplotes crassus]